jgi:predicted MFS family arabinose efflux permease
MRVCDPMLPQLADEFATSVTDLAAVITAFTIAYGMFSLVHGPLGDRRGKLGVIGAAALVAAGGSLACMTAQGPLSLILFRFLTGAACAAIIPLSLAWIGDSVKFDGRQQTLARFASAGIAGLIAGQALGGVFAGTLGWRSAFVVPAVLFLVAGVLVRRSVSQMPAPAPSASPTGVLAGYLDLLRNRWARFLMIAVSFEGGLTFGALAFVPSYLHLRFELPLWHAGLIVAAYGLGGLLFSARARSIIAVLGESRMAILGGLLLGTGFCGTLLAPRWEWVILTCGIAGLGFTMLHNTLQNQATQAHPKARGTAIAGFALCLFLGQSVGVAAAAGIIERAGFGWAFGSLGACLAALGFIVSGRLTRRRLAVGVG